MTNKHGIEIMNPRWVKKRNTSAEMLQAHRDTSKAWGQQAQDERVRERETTNLNKNGNRRVWATV